jgi:L-2-hydroxyglutarate oxidase LhgO
VADRIETLVVGAGVIGLAIARELATAGHEVVVVDQANAIGTETSSRNSEVIHAGIYYPRDTLKAQLCVEGRKLLYNYCAERGVTARAIGKLIVATTSAEIPKLKSLAAAAVANGVPDLAWISDQEAKELEPEVTCVAALFSPSTGIIDSHGYMLALQGDAESHGASIALQTRFQAASLYGREHHVLLVNSDGSEMEVSCRNIVNCAGHGAHAVARAVEGIDAGSLPPRFLAKGNYCTVSGRSPFARLIYPIPVPGALGTHVTLDLDGHIRLGPNIEWVDQLEYSVSVDVAAQFRIACRSFWPGVEDREITPSYCGIRPKVHGPDQAFADFVIDGPSRNGVPGLVNLFGIESPGLTSSLAIARYAVGLLQND